MDPAYVVLLIIVAAAIAVIAGYLIAITLILRHVVSRLVTILGAVDAVTETTQPVGAVVNDLNTDLDAGRKLIEGLVQRLEAGRAPVSATAQTPRHPVDGDGHGRDEWDETTTAPPEAAPPEPPSPLPRERHPPERSPWDDWDRSTTAAPPTSEAAPPSYEAAPPTSEAAPPTSEAAPPTYPAAPPTYQAAPPTSEAAPPTYEDTDVGTQEPHPSERSPWDEEWNRGTTGPPTFEEDTDAGRQERHPPERRRGGGLWGRRG